MDQDILVTDRVQAGEAAIRALDAAGYDVSAAFWNYFSEPGGWRLVLVPRGFEGGAVTQELLKIIPILNQASVNLDVSDIKIVASKHELIQALGRFMPKNDLGGVWASKNWIDGVYIEDAYIYRMAA